MKALFKRVHRNKNVNKLLNFDSEWKPPKSEPTGESGKNAGDERPQNKAVSRHNKAVRSRPYCAGQHNKEKHKRNRT